MAEEKKNQEIEEEVKEESVDETEKDKSGNGNNDSGDEKNGSSEEEKTFTQAQVNRMMAKEKNQGRNSVYNELGIKPGDKKILAMIKSFIESQKTDEQKAAEAEQSSNKELEEANRKVIIAEAKAEAMMLGIKKQYVEDAVTLVIAKIENEEADAKTALGELKSKYPVWFEKEDDKNSTGKKGTGSSIKSKGNNGSKKDSEENNLGARLAAKRKSGVKNSYWGKKN